MRKLKIIIFSFIVIFILSCSTNKPLISEYYFSDQPYRNIWLLFEEENVFEIENRVGLAMGGRGYGSWIILSEYKTLVTISGVTDTVDDGKAAPQGVSINIDSAINDRGFIFPLVYNDTVTFSEDYKKAYLNGYEFSLYRKRNNDKFSKFTRKVNKIN